MRDRFLIFFLPVVYPTVAALLTMYALLFKAELLVAAPLATGERFSAKKNEFSLVPPFGWEVHSDFPELSLLLQPALEEPKSENNGLSYQRTIQIMRLNQAFSVDATTAQEFEQVLVKQWERLLQPASSYRVRNHQLIKLADGREALLFYTEFVWDGTAMMQAHVLVPTAKYSYLLTYTDLATHFEGPLAAAYLKPAWTAMISFQVVGGSAPQRFASFYRVGGVSLLVVLGFACVWGLRRRRFSKILKGQEGAEAEGAETRSEDDSWRLT